VTARTFRLLASASGSRTAGERGVALVVALLVLSLLTALGMALMLTSQTETMISANYRDSMEGEYVADAGIERVMDDVLTVPGWNMLITSTDGITSSVTSSFHGSPVSIPIALPDGRSLDLAKVTNMINCAKTTTCSGADMNAYAVDRPWTTNNPRFRLYAWGAVNDLIPTGTVNSPYYVAVWIADDSTENDGDPTADGSPPVDGSRSNPGRGVLTLRSEAFGPNGAQHVIEATISRTDRTDVERGDSKGLNNGVGDVGVRILSWRDIR
jgi:PilX N-terminal